MKTTCHQTLSCNYHTKKMKKYLITAAAFFAIAGNLLKADELSNTLNSIRSMPSIPTNTAQSGNSAPRAKLLELPEVVASVNGNFITRAQLQDVFNAAMQSSGTNLADLTRDQQLGGYTQLLNDLIDRQLLLSAASKMDVSHEDVEVEIKKFKSQFPDEAIFDTQMKQAGMNPEKLQNDVREELKIRSWMESRINPPEILEADAKSFYDANINEFKQPETIKASHILFIVDTDAPPDVVKQKEKAAKKAAVRAKIGEDFSAIAKELSEEPGAKESGGDLGFFPKDRMVPEFANAAFALNINDISEPVKTQFGWHVIKVTDKNPAGTMPFSKAKDQIVDYLKKTKQRDAVQNVIKELKDNADIKIFIK